MSKKMNSFQEGKKELNVKLGISSVNKRSGFKEGTDLVKANIAGELGKRIANWPAIIGAQDSKQAE